MTTPTAPADVYEALFALQSERIVLIKDKDGQVGNQKTKYSDLVQTNEVILPRLFAFGLLWLTAPTLRMIPGPNGQEDPRFVLDWTLRHVASGTAIEGTYPLMDAGTAMKAGSAISYARRYALLAITNAVAQDEDDDGRGGVGRARAGYAQREVAPPSRPAAETTQRAAGRPERARPAQQPEPPAPTSGAPTQGDQPFRGRGGLITQPMTQKLAICMGEVGLTGGARLPYVVDLIDRQIGSSKDLTFDEGRHLIDAFEKAKGSDDPQTVAANIYVRTTTGVPAEETGQPPAAKKSAPRGRRPAETRPVAEQARAAVLGDPNGAGADEAAPWDNEPPAVD